MRKITMYFAWFISAIIYIFIAIFCISNLVNLIGWFNIDNISIKDADPYLSGYIELFGLVGSIGRVVVVDLVICVTCILLAILLISVAMLFAHSYITLRRIFMYCNEHNPYKTILFDGVLNIVMFSILLVVCIMFKPEPLDLLCILYMLGYGVWKVVYAKSVG